MKRPVMTAALVLGVLAGFLAAGPVEAAPFAPLERQLMNAIGAGDTQSSESARLALPRPWRARMAASTPGSLRSAQVETLRARSKSLRPRWDGAHGGCTVAFVGVAAEALWRAVTLKRSVASHPA